MARRCFSARRTDAPGRTLGMASVLLGIYLLSLSVSAYAQIAFERTYGDSGLDSGYDARQTTDGGYIVVGGTSSLGAGDSDVYIVRTDSLGDTLWTRAYGGSSGDRGRCVRQTSDGGYIIAGTTMSFGAGERDVYLIKTDSAGDTLWTRTYGGIRSEFGFAVMQTLDGGYVIVGETASFGAGMADVYLVRTDAAGDTLWTRAYGGAGDDKCYSIDYAWGSGYIFGGYSRAAAPYYDDFFLLRTDTLGNTLWSRVYNRLDTQYGRCARQTTDGGYIIVGEHSPAGPDDADVFAIKTDSAGDTLWTGTYGGVRDDLGYSVDQTCIGNHVFVGWSKSFHSDPWFKLYVLETDPWGSEIFSQVYGPPLWWTYGMSVQQTLDCGYIISGYAITDDPSRGTEVYLVKTPGIAQEIHDGAVIALGSPGDTVLPDSTYPVKATVRNFGNTVESFPVIVAIDGYTDMSLVSGLQPGSAARVTFADWQVPSADSTLYTMTVFTQVSDDYAPHNDTMQKAIFACNPVIGTEELFDRASRLDFRLWQSSPNPFHRSTAIQYSLPTECDVTLSVYDATGRLMETLAEERQGPGVFGTRWNPQGCADGIYFCRLMACPERSPELGEGRSRRAGNLTETRKMVLVR